MLVVESKLSDQLWLSFSLALAKPNKKARGTCPKVLLYILYLFIDFNLVRGISERCAYFVEWFITVKLDPIFIRFGATHL